MKNEGVIGPDEDSSEEVEQSMAADDDLDQILEEDEAALEDDNENVVDIILVRISRLYLFLLTYYLINLLS